MTGTTIRTSVARKMFMHNVFPKILYKISFHSRKTNQSVLGIDLLKEGIRKELLLITVLRIEETYTKLLNESNPGKFMQKNGTGIFFKCLKKICEDFFTKQYGYKTKVNLLTFKKSAYLKDILEDVEILFKVPFYALIDSQSTVFRLVYSPVYDLPSETFLEALIDHLILEISNCVVYFSIVQFSSIDTFRLTLYRSRFISLRNFERFKNNLAWQLFIKNYVQRPFFLYNNFYEIYVIRSSGIYLKTIYANRSKEIVSLNRTRLLTIIFVELTDFLTSRFDEIIYFISKGVRFTLTDVLGQTVSLIWRGIIEGLKK